jgi:hypothetical protein
VISRRPDTKNSPASFSERDFLPSTFENESSELLLQHILGYHDELPFNFTAEELSKFFTQPGVLEHLQQVINIGRSCLPLREYEQYQQKNVNTFLSRQLARLPSSLPTQTYREQVEMHLDPAPLNTMLYQLFKEGIEDWLWLTIPFGWPDQHDGIKQAEESRHIPHISRETQHIWLPGLQEEGYRSLTHVPIQGLANKELKDAHRWLHAEGLIGHLFMVTELYQLFHQAIWQPILRNKSHQFYQEAPHYLEQSVSCLLHDIGRLVTHDPVWHAVVGKVIFKELGLPPHLCEDEDLPSLTGWDLPQPTFEAEDVSGIIEAFGLNTALRYMVDCYAKLMVDPRFQEEEFHPLKCFRLRKIGDEAIFLGQRDQHYGQGKVSFGSIAYERQALFLQSFIKWLIDKHYVTEKQLNKIFHEANIKSHHIMARLGLRYQYDLENPHYALNQFPR